MGAVARAAQGAAGCWVGTLPGGLRAPGSRNQRSSNWILPALEPRGWRAAISGCARAVSFPLGGFFYLGRERGWLEVQAVGPRSLEVVGRKERGQGVWAQGPGLGPSSCG